MAAECPPQANIAPECLAVNTLGQCVNVCHPNTASGYYPLSDNAVNAMNEAGTNLCPEGMRPGRMVIKGLPATDSTPGGYINTCGGKTSQEDMPDVNIIEWRYRIYFNLALAILIVVMLGSITVKIFK